MDALRHLLGQPSDRDEVEQRLSLRERDLSEQGRRIDALRQASDRRRDQDAVDDARTRREIDMRLDRGGSD